MSNLKFLGHPSAEISFAVTSKVLTNETPVVDGPSGEDHASSATIVSDVPLSPKVRSSELSSLEKNLDVNNIFNEPSEEIVEQPIEPLIERTLIVDESEFFDLEYKLVHSTRDRNVAELEGLAVALAGVATQYIQDWDRSEMIRV
jgi:hypothetical protein